MLTRSRSVFPLSFLLSTKDLHPANLLIAFWIPLHLCSIAIWLLLEPVGFLASKYSKMRL
jgi:hypothetical protein